MSFVFEDFQIANYADDAALYNCQKNFIDIQIKLENDFLILFDWLK